ncbi:TIGR04086 family membrane protein [Bacillaceae bacterium SIJ1]|uniref:TIGR04086 family membrane protein n=1 Tax=Litoribacterium kuwaitense TaxID=1398745 RepID=UPI0013EB0D44|nr:TIGR04086 family membrane protein [Litoribacterium kuwaitense]NGP43435.1 TIGR04086 family membrane protein [Litoribacterium kuwaitense]
MITSLKSIGRGSLIIILWIIGASLFIATLLRFTSVTEQSLDWLYVTAGCLAFFFGGWSAGTANKEKGLMIGLTTGVAVSMIIAIIQWTGYNTGLSLHQGLYHLLYIALALIGGILGVNRVTVNKR